MVVKKTAFSRLAWSSMSRSQAASMTEENLSTSEEEAEGVTRMSGISRPGLLAPEPGKVSKDDEDLFMLDVITSDLTLRSRFLPAFAGSPGTS